MLKLGEIADKYYFLGWTRYQIRRVKLYPQYRKAMKYIKKREQGYEDKEYIKLKNMKNIYNGKRCFIVATGPSLTISDVEMLKDEITFGVNSICKLTTETSWRPTYLGIQDVFVYEKLENILLNNKEQCVLAGSSLCHRFTLPDRFIKFPSLWNHKLYMNSYGKYDTKFSDNAYSVVYDGYSITYSIIQIAVYMGFKEIYLLGCDCSYKKGKKNHFIESGFVDRHAEMNYAKMISGYRRAKEYADAHGIKIINCTRGGMLEIFPRMALEDVLGKG